MEYSSISWLSSSSPLEITEIQNPHIPNEYTPTKGFYIGPIGTSSKFLTIIMLFVFMLFTSKPRLLFFFFFPPFCIQQLKWSSLISSKYGTFLIDHILFINSYNLKASQWNLSLTLIKDLQQTCSAINLVSLWRMHKSAKNGIWMNVTLPTWSLTSLFSLSSLSLLQCSLIYTTPCWFNLQNFSIELS